MLAVGSGDGATLNVWVQGLRTPSIWFPLLSISIFAKGTGHLEAALRNPGLGSRVYTPHGGVGLEGSMIREMLHMGQPSLTPEHPKP